MLGPMDLLRNLVDALSGRTDAGPDWSEDEPDACEPGEAADCQEERASAALLAAPSGRLPVFYPALDLQAKAATAKYPDGRIKRTAFPRVRLAQRRVVIVLHQVGAERSSANSRWHLITAHSTIKPDGTRCRLHPLDVRLIEANRFDRAPWHGIGIEVGGNFEGTDGAGDWYKPARFGRGRASDAQIEATRQEVESICEGVALLGGRVEGIAPHRVSGRDKKGRPNRHLCPGSRVWSQVGEWAGAELGLAVPGPTFALGGTRVPDAWHGPYWPRCRRFL